MASGFKSSPPNTTKVKGGKGTSPTRTVSVTSPGEGGKGKR